MTDGIKLSWARFIKYIPFLKEMVRKDFTSKYKRSNLGVVWSVLNPLLTMLVMVLVFSNLFGREITHFPAYILNANIIFNLFTEASNGCMTSIRSGGGLILRTSVPKFIFPLSKCVLALVNQIISFIVAVAIMLVVGVTPSWTMILFPIPVFYTIVFSFGVGLTLATAMMYFQDIQYLYGVITRLLMYLSAIFYPISNMPASMIPVFNANPVYLFITMMRNVMIYQTVPTLSEHLVCIAFCVGSLAIGIPVFRSKQGEFALKM